MKTKEEIINELIDEKWPVDESNHSRIRNKLAKLSSWGIEHMAMDEYSKEIAIGFAEWAEPYYWQRITGSWQKIGLDGDPITTEQLYDEYLKQIQ